MLGCQRRARLTCNSGVITTALLFEQGINYPEPDKDLADPKHQFLVSALQTNDLARLRRILEENQSDSVLLSTEGLTNHLYDFDAGALQTFRDLTLDYEVVIFIVVREKEPWLRSYYKQLVLNPPIVEYNYATPLRYAAFCELPRVCRLLTPRRLRQIYSPFLVQRRLWLHATRKIGWRRFLTCLVLVQHESLSLVVFTHPSRMIWLNSFVK